MLTGLTGVVLTWMDPAMPKIFPPSLAKVKTSDGLLICQAKQHQHPSSQTEKFSSQPRINQKKNSSRLLMTLSLEKNYGARLLVKDSTKITGLIMLEPHL